MIDDKAHHPGSRKLEQNDSKSHFFASHFPIDRGDGRRTRHIEQAEHHQRIRVGRTESHGCQERYEAAHTVSCSDVLDTEKHTAAGDHNFLCRDP